LKKKEVNFTATNLNSIERKNKKLTKEEKRIISAILRYHYTLLRISYIRKLAIFGIFCQFWQKILCLPENIIKKEVDDDVSPYNKCI